MVLSSTPASLPILRLRKDIWTHFPVCLVKLPQQKDGRDRYSIQWHQKNLELWCQKITGYENVARIRLMCALINSNRWIVEPAQNPTDLCIIAMQFSEEPRQFTSLPNIHGECTELTSVESIKEFFPICWKTRKNRYTLEFHNTHVRALAAHYDMSEADIRTHTLERLLPLLKSSGWCIDMPVKTTSEICTIYH